MFRRKEESATDASHESSDQASMSMTAGGSAPIQEILAPTSSAAASSAAASSHSSPYAPAQAQSARPAAAATGSYRPAAPLADFSRGASARPAESQRPANASSSSNSAQANSAAAPSFTALSDKASQKTNRRVLTVGNDILLKGEIATCDRLVIEGRVEAKLSDVHTVEIAECGSFKGTAEVEEAEISGVFEGDLIVRNRLVVYASGEVRGNITYGEIEIERGGRLTGQIKTVAVSTSAQLAGKSASPSAQEVKARAASKEFAA
jgi:cytoskeletal protein CcmA (bactofilin family)